MTYRAFVSSTFVDLKNHRAHVIRSLRRAGFFVDPMEDWTADNDEPKKFSQQRLDGCHLCILLVAFRRGTVPDGETLSITQLEHAAAVNQGIDILPFMLDENAPWVHKFYELDRDPEIKAWRVELGKRHGVEYFGLDPTSIDMTGALGRWLANRSGGENNQGEIGRLAWPESKSPYPGLLSFDQDYAELFFGRDRDVDAVIAKMSEPNGRFLIISGPSGCGKSSLVGAGLRGVLSREERIPGSRNWEWLPIQPGDGKTTPFEALAWGLKQTLRISQRPEKIAEELGGEVGKLGTLLKQQLSGDRELLLFVDQLEQLFTRGFKDVDIGNFLEQLVAATRDKKSQLRVLATLRGDFTTRLEEIEWVPELLLNAGCNYHLGPVSPRVLQDMIERPAMATGYDFQPGLVDDILCDAAQEPGNLPLVAYALKQLFERRQGRTFAYGAYNTIGGVVGAIGTQADQVIAGLDVEAVGAFDRVFAELVRIEREGPPTRKRVALSVFDSDRGAGELIAALAAPDCRILVTGASARDPSVEVAHEKLFTGWPRLREWIDKGGEALRLIEHAGEAARRWHDRGENAQEIWHADRAAEVSDALRRFGRKAPPLWPSFYSHRIFCSINSSEMNSLTSSVH
jgi:energy-coupling factor transporter ATP-binding protein EcfA2